MTKRLSYLILMLLFMGCERDRTETVTIKLEGKPVNLVYVYHLSEGSLRWSYQGEIEGKVGVCISGCEHIVENQYAESCPKVETFTGKFRNPTLIHSGDDYLYVGKIQCFVFVPEEDTRGEIRVTFTESRRPLSAFVENP